MNKVKYFQKSSTIIFFISISNFIYALNPQTDVLLPYKKAQIYSESDLAIVGIIIDKEKKLIEKVKIEEDDGWTNYYERYYDKCIMQVDSIIKGSTQNKSINFMSQPYNSIPHKNKFDHIDESGDSIFQAQSEIGYDLYSSGIENGEEYIIIFKVINNIYNPLLIELYDDNIIDFYDEVKKRGVEYLIPE
ncbi:hypothetical protein KKA87_07250 [bacterium]|nr:hypothetical protein [bacterium]MBU1872419.1 hypothetical protein [bacterium]